MSTDPVPELEPDVLAVVRDARRIVEPSDAARARMRSRLRAALPPQPGGGGDGDGGASAGPEPAPIAALPKVPLWTVAAALAVGVTGGLLYPRAPVERVVTVAGPPLVVSADRSASPAPTLPSIALNDLPSATPANGAPSVSARGTGGSALEAERALLDVARTALGRGDGTNALAACDDHARKFPRGALGEEREAIAVQALVLGQRGEDAKLRAERFRKAYPRSILLPAVLAAAGIEQ